MKKLLISLIAFTTLIPITQAFTDVPRSAWYYPYVTELEEMGVIDSTDTFRPNDALKRNEFMKMIIIAIGGFEGYTRPAVASFTDVSRDNWAFDYIEAAFTHGIVSGYADSAGNPTGQFGPGDTLTRAQATKILVNAFKIPTDLEPASPFSDVRPSVWYHDFVLTAYNQSILDGYLDGTFGPNDPVTRSQAAKLIITALDPKERVGGDEGGGEPIPDEPGSTVPPTSPVEDPQEPEEPVVQEPEIEFTDTTFGDAIVPAGTEGKFVGKYRFYGRYEDFNINTLTIVNDVTGDKMGDQVEDTFAVKKIYIRYPNIDEQMVVKESSMSAGKASFAGLDFYVPKRGESFLEVYADISPMSAVGDQLSGETIRLGLQNTANSLSTFESVGLITSDTSSYNNTLLTKEQLYDNEPATFVIRKSKPVFALVEIPEILALGSDRELIRFTVTADDNGSVGFGRLVFEVNLDSDLELNEFSFLKNGSQFETDEIGIYGNSINLMASGGTPISGNHKVIVSFDQEEIVGAGNAVTYSLRAKINGDADGAYVSTRLSDDDQINPLTPMTDYLVGGIFANTDDFLKSADNNKNIIWSDRSADFHEYSVSGGGSEDFTNGYLIPLSGLGSHTLND
jgi:hypothetical protein